MSAPDSEYQPGTADATQNDYKSRTGQGEIPVVGDDAAIEDPINAQTADSDEQLGMCSFPFDHVVRGLLMNSARDDKDAIDQNNIIDDRTRGATAKQGTYREPGDEEGLEGNDGRSRVAGGPN